LLDLLEFDDNCMMMQGLTNFKFITKWHKYILVNICRENCSLLGYYAVSIDNSLQTFRKNYRAKLQGPLKRDRYFVPKRL